MPDAVYDADMNIGGRQFADKAAAARSEYAKLQQERLRRYGKAAPKNGEDDLLRAAESESKLVFQSLRNSALSRQMAQNATRAIEQGFAVEVPTNYIVPESVMDAAEKSSGGKTKFQLTTKDTFDVFDRSGYRQYLDGVVFSGHTMMRGNDRPMFGTVIKTGKGYAIAVKGDELNKAAEASAPIAGVYNVVGESKDFMRQIVGGEATRQDGAEHNQLFNPKETYYMMDVAEDAIDMANPPEFVRVSDAIRPADRESMQKRLNKDAGPKIDFAARNNPQTLTGAKASLKEDANRGWPWIQRPDDEAAAYQNPTIKDANGNKWTVVADGMRNANGEFTYILELNDKPVASIVSPVFDPNKLLSSQIDALFSAVNPDWFYVAKQPKK
jgi:hypothetical protein